MKTFFIFLLSAFILSISCYGKNIDNSKGDTWKFDSLYVSKKVYIDNDATKDGMSINFNFIYPVSVSGNVDLKKVQNIFANIIFGKKDFQGTPQEAFDKILADYTSDAEEMAKDMEDEDSDFPRFSNFEYNRSSNIKTETELLLTIYAAGHSYTGGAHGSYGVFYYTIDKKSGDLIEEEQLFKPGYKEKVATLIQNVIEERNNSMEEGDEIGLLVDLNEVMPNGNFYFSNEGIVYVYNIYEIAPYAQGMTEITVPYSQISSLINSKYLPIIENLKQGQN